MSKTLSTTILILSAGLAEAQGHVDRVFLNGRIWTADDAHPSAEALAISGDRIVAVGSTAEIRKLASTDTAVVDLKGLRVIPGFQDSHAHFPGPSINEVALEGIENLQEMQSKIAAFAKAHPELPWIVGHGWTYSAFPDLKVHRKYLDAAVAGRPVYLTERDGHMGLANGKALAIAGITRSTANVANGQIMRDPDENPTGELKEAAQSLVFKHIPPDTDEVTYRTLLHHMADAAAHGLTAIQNASWSPRDHTAFLRALAAGELKLRFRLAPPILPGEGLAPKKHVLARPLTSADLAAYRELRATFKGPLIEFGAIKGMLDGTVDAKTAAMFEPYVGDPNSSRGIPFWEQNELNQTVALYDQEGFQLMLHAIGDKAVHMALDAYEYAAKVNHTTGRRHRIEHIEVPLLADLARFRQLGVIASTQAIFASPDPDSLQNFAVVLGPERSSHADSFKLFDDAGAVQAFGSDWPVFYFSPFEGIYTAVTRMTPQGTPAGGWYPKGKITVEAALRHYTRDGAYASFAEGVRGTLAAGKLADLVVLSKDILTITPEDILKTKPLLTVMGGRDTYRDPEMP